MLASERGDSGTLLPAGNNASPYGRPIISGIGLLVAAGLILLGGVPSIAGSPVDRQRGVTEAVPSGLSAALAVTGFTAFPSTVVRGNTTQLNVTVTGGTTPYSYSYAGLPEFCKSQNVASLYCTPSELRTFQIVVTVNDSAGGSVQASTNLTVTNGFTGPPVITSLTVYPTSVAVDHVAEINVTAQSTSSLGYFFADLPIGCTSFNASQLFCIPKVPGTFVVHVLVSDGFGTVSQRTVTMTVTGTADLPPPPSTTSAPNPLVVIGVVGAIAVVAGAAGFLILRRKEGGGRGVRPAVPP